MLKLDQIERRLERLRSRLYRTVNAINKLERTQRRLKKQPSAIAVAAVKAAGADVATVATQAVKATETLSESCDRIVTERIMSPAKTDTLDIKEQPWIKSASRSNLTESDKKAIAEIQAEQKDKKKSLAAARIAKMKARMKGEMRKMPLQGKAALAEINKE